MITPSASKFENEWLINMAVVCDQKHRQISDIKQPHERKERKGTQGTLHVRSRFDERRQLPSPSA